MFGGLTGASSVEFCQARSFPRGQKPEYADYALSSQIFSAACVLPSFAPEIESRLSLPSPRTFGSVHRGSPSKRIARAAAAKEAYEYLIRSAVADSPQPARGNATSSRGSVSAPSENVIDGASRPSVTGSLHRELRPGETYTQRVNGSSVPDSRHIYMRSRIENPY